MMEKEKDKENFTIVTGICIKDYGKMGPKKDTEKYIIKQEKYLKAILVMIKLICEA